MIRLLMAYVVFATALVNAKPCGSDGVHEEINVKQIQIQYAGVSVRATFDALAKIGVDVSTVQTASQETQRINQYLQALVVGFNNCTITKAQYLEATRLILPQAKQDMDWITFVEGDLAKGEKVSEGRLRDFIQRYLSTLKDLAGVAGLENDVSRLQVEIEDLQNDVKEIKRENTERKAKDEEAERQRRLVPELEAKLVPVNRFEMDLVIASKNGVPFNYRFSISIPGPGRLIPWTPFQPYYPAGTTSPLVIPVRIDLPDNRPPLRTMVDFEFGFKSLSFDELHLPGHSGNFSYRYYLAPDATSWYQPQLASGDYLVGDGPTDPMFDGEDVWVVNSGENSVTRLNAKDGNQFKVFKLSMAGAFCYDGSSVWVGTTGKEVLKLGQGSGDIVGRYPVGDQPISIICDSSHVWTANYSDGTITKLLGRNGATVATIKVGTFPRGIAFDGVYLWVINSFEGNIYQIRDADGVKMGEFFTKKNLSGISFDGSALWILNSTDETVIKLRPTDGQVLKTFSTQTKKSRAFCVDHDYIWIASSVGTLTKLDKQNGRITQTFDIGTNPHGVACDGTHAWVANFDSATVSRR